MALYPNYPQQPIYNPYAQNYYQPYTAQVPSPLKLDTVSGKTSADVYNVEPGQQAILFDIDNPLVYKKQRGMDNKLTMEVFDLSPHVDKDEAEKVEYVKADEIDRLLTERVKEELDKRLSEISFAPKTRRSSKEE